MNKNQQHHEKKSLPGCHHCNFHFLFRNLPYGPYLLRAHCLGLQISEKVFVDSLREAGRVAEQENAQEKHHG